MVVWKVERGRRTVVKARGRKRIDTNVRSLTFSPNLVEARLSMTALALKSWMLSALAHITREHLPTASLNALVDASFCLKESR